LSINISTLLSAIITNSTNKLLNKLAYQIPLAIMMVAPAVLFLGVFFVPETPRWLVVRGRPEEGRRALKALRGGATSEIEQIEEFAAIVANHEYDVSQGKDKPKVLDLFRGVNLRRTVLTTCACCLHAASGSQFLISYGTYFYTMAKVANPFEMNIVVTVVGIGGVLCSLVCIRIFDRRNQILLGSSVGGIAQLIAGAVYTANPGTTQTGNIIIGMMGIYNFFYAFSIGPYAWTIAAEMCSQRLRSLTLGFATAINFALSYAITVSIPYIVNPAALNLGGKYCFVWFGSLTIVVIWAYFFLPESKDRTMEEMEEMFEKRLPARKFKGYVCSATLQAEQAAALAEKDAIVETTEQV